MAAVVSSSYVPRQGILLNPSPSVSPYHHSVSLPPLVPSNSSLSSSASSVSNLNTDSDYFSASTHASPAVAGTHNPHVAHQQKPCAGSMPTTSRRIRFAPLPEPRREAFVADEGELPLSSVAADDSAIIDARKNVSPGSFSLKNQQTKWHSAVEANERRTPGDLLFSDGGVGSVNGSAIRLLASESTPTLASTATATSNPNPNIPVPVSASASASSSSTAPSELDGGDWEHRHSTPATPQKSGGDLPSLTDSPRRSASNGSKWSKKLFKPLLAPLSKGASYSVEDVRSTLSNSLPSPEPGSEGCMPGRSRASDPAKERERREEKEKKRSKSKPRERDPEWVREFGMPLYRFASEGDPWGVPLKNKRGEAMTMAEIREAGPEIWRQRERELERQRARSGSGTRMLNGRVYGAKRLANEQARANGRNAFANVRWVLGCLACCILRAHSIFISFLFLFPFSSPGVRADSSPSYHTGTSPSSSNGATAVWAVCKLVTSVQGSGRECRRAGLSALARMKMLPQGRMGQQVEALSAEQATRRTMEAGWRG